MNEINYKKDLPDDIEGLRLELRKQMDNIVDEVDVERIRDIVNKMDDIEPMEMPLMSTEEFLVKFNEEIYPKAVKMREEIEQIRKFNERMIRKCNKRQRVWVNVLGLVFSMIVAIAVLNICTISFAGFNIFKPIVSWTDKVFNKSYNYISKDNFVDYDIDKMDYDYKILENLLDCKIYKPSKNNKNFILKEIEFHNKSSIAYYISATYKINDYEVIYLATIFQSNNQGYEQSIEKTDREVVIYKEKDIDFYIIQNTNWYVITWSDDNIDYVVSGFKEFADTKEFISSLEK